MWRLSARSGPFLETFFPLTMSESTTQELRENSEKEWKREERGVQSKMLSESVWRRGGCSLHEGAGLVNDLPREIYKRVDLRRTWNRILRKVADSGGANPSKCKSWM